MAITILRWTAAALVLLSSAATAQPQTEAQGEPQTAVEAKEVPVRIYVAPAFVSPLAQPIARGYAEWIRMRIGSRDTQVLRPPPAALEARGEHPARSAARAAGQITTADEAISWARALDASHALIFDLRWHDGRVTVDFRLYDVGGENTLSGRAVTASAAEFVATTETPLWETLEAIDLGAHSRGFHGASLEDLTTASRTLDHLDRGAFTKAWQTAGRGRSALLRDLRAEAEKLGSATETPRAERARLFAAQGRADMAWDFISQAAEQAYANPELGIPVLLAAGEIQLERGELETARAYYSKVLEAQPQNAEASLGLGRVMAKAGRTEEAARAFRHSAHYDPVSPEPLAQWAELENPDPKVTAVVLLAAGERYGEQLQVDSAQQQLARVLADETDYSAVAMERQGDLHLLLGEYEPALERYASASEAGGANEARLLGTARSQAGLGHTDEARQTYVTLLDSSHDNADAHGELGEILASLEEFDPAIEHLEKAVSLTPTNVDPKRALARSLHKRGSENDLKRAEDLYRASEEEMPLGFEDLTDLAQIQRTRGNLDGARSTLERAVSQRENDVTANVALAEVIEAQGDVVTANLIRERLAFYGNSDYDALGSTDQLVVASSDAPELAENLDAMLKSFAELQPVRRVVLLGVRERREITDPVRDWLYPRVPDLSGIETELRKKLAAHHALVGLGELEGALTEELGAVFDFDSEDSLDPDMIVELNLSLTVDGSYVARLIRREGNPLAAGGACAREPHFELEMRRLDGQKAGDVQVFGQGACLEGGLWGPYGGWNYRAAAIMLAALALLYYPFWRGWGTVDVHFSLPPKTRALFSVSLRRTPARVKDRSDKAKVTNSHFFERQLQRRQISNLGRFTKKLDGERTTFRWVPARRNLYVVVRGPLVDLSNEETVGEFLQEKTIYVQKGSINSLRFDMRTNESAINVNIKMLGNKVPRARIALLDSDVTSRFARDGVGLIYAPLGRHHLQIGYEDRVAEIPLELETPAPVQLNVELDDPSVLLFTGCPEAVDPYLDGNARLAGELLEEAGLKEAARRVREGIHPSPDQKAVTARSAAPAEAPAPAAATERPASPARDATFEETFGDNASFVELDESSAEIGDLDLDIDDADLENLE